MREMTFKSGVRFTRHPVPSRWAIWGHDINIKWQRHKSAGHTSGKQGDRTVRALGMTSRFIIVLFGLFMTRYHSHKKNVEPAEQLFVCRDTWETNGSSSSHSQWLDWGTDGPPFLDAGVYQTEEGKFFFFFTSWHVSHIQQLFAATALPSLTSTLQC